MHSSIAGRTPRRPTAIAAMFAALLPAAPALADWEVNMPVGVTEISRETYDLHMLIFWVCVVIAVVVFGAMAYAIFAFRKSQGAVAASFDHSTRAEIIWTLIPTLILIFMAIPAARTLILIEDTRETELTIKITGYQWKWEYEYRESGVSFYSTLARSSAEARMLNSPIDPYSVENYLLEVDRPLVVPAGVKIRYLLTSNDVLHAWWVPDLSVKKDAIPGYINEGWFEIEQPGVYRGQCAELCGKDHGFMPVVVEALPKEEFDAWIAERVAEANAKKATRVAQQN